MNKYQVLDALDTIEPTCSHRVLIRAPDGRFHEVAEISVTYEGSGRSGIRRTKLTIDEHSSSGFALYVIPADEAELYLHPLIPTDSIPPAPGTV